MLFAAGGGGVDVKRFILFSGLGYETVGAIAAYQGAFDTAEQAKTAFEQCKQEWAEIAEITDDGLKFICEYGTWGGLVTGRFTGWRDC